jgi:hypothetical protein
MKKLIKASVFITIIFASGCNSEKKALRKTQEYLFRHPDFSAGYCAEQFPDKPDSVIIKELETITDTLWGLNYDTVINRDTVTIIQTKTNTVTKVLRRDSIIYRENKAEQHRLELQLDKCQSNYNSLLDKYNEQGKLLVSWKGKAKTRWLWIALLIGGAVAYTGFKLYSKKLFT